MTAEPVEPGRPRRLEEHFMAAAARFPDHPAIHAGELDLSYAEVRAGAVALAHRLADEGVGPETVVGLLLDRGPSAIMAILAVHLAGGAYLPISPDLPEERLAYILSDARPRLLVSTPDLLPVAQRSGLPTLPFDVGEPATGSPAGPPEPSRPLQPEDLAWIIYTSGSTGVPKAVLVSHAGIDLVAEFQRRRLGLRQHERILQLASPSFDACIFEFLLAFTCAGTLFIPELVGEADRDLAGFLRQHRITVAGVPPGVLASVQDPELLPDLHTVLVGGDTCSVPVAARWGHRPLWNVYGLTETTVISTAHRVSERDVAAGEVPVGPALPGATCYVLDEDLCPVGAGEAGELYIGGEGVSRGYLGAPALTAERYLPDPFAKTPGARFYRTKDRFRIEQDGVLYFLGRVDRQAKIRGYRVELDEIELAMRRTDQIADAVVLAEPDPAGAGLRLVGYLTARNGSVDQAALRRSMGRMLPAQMIPSVFHQLPSMPTNANGKIDRDAVARLAVRAPAPTAPPIPRNTEEFLTAVYSELLGAPAGPADSFFELGGHSLTANRLLRTLRSEFGEQVPSGIVYDHPVVAELAAVLDGLGGRGRALPDAPPLLARASRRPARRS